GAKREWMVLREGALALQAGGDWRLEQLGQLAELIPGARIVDALTSVDHRPLGAGERLRHPLDVARIRTGANALCRAIIGRLGDVGVVDVPGHLDGDRARP